jgi:hypothetical protein
MRWTFIGKKTWVGAGRTALRVRTPTRRRVIGSMARGGRAACLLSLALRCEAQPARLLLGSRTNGGEQRTRWICAEDAA